MKRALIIFFFLSGFFASGYTNAQDLDHYQFYLNLPGTNSGFTGIEDFWDVKAGFRQGWKGASSPNNSFYFGAYGLMNASYQSIQRNNTLRISNPDQYDELLEDKRLKRKLLRRHGLGLMFSSRQIGNYQAVTGMINYAYHLPVTNSLKWSLGTSVRYNGQQIGLQGLEVRDEANDLFYQQLIASNAGKMNLMIVDFGTTLYADNFYLGLSSLGLIDYAFGANDFDGFLPGLYSLQAGSFLDIGVNMELYPLIKLDYSNLNDLTWMINTRVRFREVVYAGLGYSSDSRITALVGFTLQDTYSLNYSYDYFLSNLRSFNVSAHEIVLGLGIFNKYGLEAKTW